jgi:hypothetical protein
VVPWRPSVRAAPSRLGYTGASFTSERLYAALTVELFMALFIAT